MSEFSHLAFLFSLVIVLIIITCDSSGSQIRCCLFCAPLNVLAIVMPFPIFSQEITDILFSFCATSPQAQHNQIAVACRATNILWRRMHRTMVHFLLNRIIRILVEEDDDFWTVHPLHDVRDVLWVIQILWILCGFQCISVGYDSIMRAGVLAVPMTRLAYTMFPASWLRTKNISLLWHFACEHLWQWCISDGCALMRSSSVFNFFQFSQVRVWAGFARCWSHELKHHVDIYPCFFVMVSTD